MSSHMCTSCGFYGAGKLLEEHRKVKITKQGTFQIILNKRKGTPHEIFAFYQEHVFTCVDCDNILETKTNLEKHIEDNHPAKCGQCQDEFRLTLLAFLVR